MVANRLAQLTGLVRVSLQQKDNKIRYTVAINSSVRWDDFIVDNNNTSKMVIVSFSVYHNCVLS